MNSKGEDYCITDAGTVEVLVHIVESNDMDKVT